MERRRTTTEVNASTMADIAFLLLIFFLVATTMDVDTGIPRVLPPAVNDADTSQNQIIKEKNVFVILINSKDQLLVEGNPLAVEQIKDKCKEFLTTQDTMNFPDYEIKSIPFVGNIPVSKGVVSIQNDRNTSYSKYIEVQDALLSAYNEVRDEFSLRYFGVKMYRLSTEKQKAVKLAVPIRISEAEPYSAERSGND